MFKALLTAFAIAFTTAVCAAPDPSAWYTPSEDDYRPPEKLSAACNVVDSRGKRHDVTVDFTLDENGGVTNSSLKDSLEGLNLSVSSAIDLIDNTMMGLVATMAELDYLNAQFHTLGKNLTKIFQIDGMKFNISGNSYTLRIADGALKQAASTGTTVEYIDEDGLFLSPDGQSIEKKDHQIAIKGWSSPDTHKSTYTVADCLQDNAKRSYYYLLGRDGQSIKYIPIGHLSDIDCGNGSPTDETSVTTNMLNGAIDDGLISLYGFKTAKEDFIPVKGSSRLSWRGLDASLAFDNEKLGVKDAVAQTSAKRYFGTAQDTPSLGWHDLPNVTTNAVEGDERTITTVSNEQGIKRLGWKSLPPMIPSLAYNLGDGNIGWLPYEDPSMALDEVSISTNSSGQISLAGFEGMQEGVICKEGDTLAVKTITASNGIERSDSDGIALGLEGFQEGGNCSIPLGDLLFDSLEDENRGNHQILARYVDADKGVTKLHYIPLSGLFFPRLTDIWGEGSVTVRAETQDAPCREGGFVENAMIRLESAGNENTIVRGVDEEGNFIVAQESDLVVASAEHAVWAESAPWTPFADYAETTESAAWSVYTKSIMAENGVVSRSAQTNEVSATIGLQNWSESKNKTELFSSSLGDGDAQALVRVGDELKYLSLLQVAASLLRIDGEQYHLTITNAYLRLVNDKGQPVYGLKLDVLDPTTGNPID